MSPPQSRGLVRRRYWKDGTPVNQHWLQWAGVGGIRSMRQGIWYLKN